MEVDCGVIAHNFLLNYSLFEITVNLSKKVQFSSDIQNDMSDDGIYSVLQVAQRWLCQKHVNSQ